MGHHQLESIRTQVNSEATHINYTYWESEDRTRGRHDIDMRYAIGPIDGCHLPISYLVSDTFFEHERVDWNDLSVFQSKLSLRDFEGGRVTVGGPVDATGGLLYQFSSKPVKYWVEVETAGSQDVVTSRVIRTVKTFKGTEANPHVSVSDTGDQAPSGNGFGIDFATHEAAESVAAALREVIAKCKGRDPKEKSGKRK